jgi:hypothetical protein
VHPAVDLERAPDASRNDGQVVGGVPAPSVLPLDEAGWVSWGEEDVLSEEVAVDENARFVGREMSACPTSAALASVASTSSSLKLPVSGASKA